MKTNNVVLTLVIALIFAFTGGVYAQDTKVQNVRPSDKSGINVFEVKKSDNVIYDGLKVKIGGHFTQQFQSLSHENAADFLDDGSGNDLNSLQEIGAGFNTATANLNLDVQLEDGITMSLVTYLSSRHHPEAWVKGGYLKVDKLTVLNSEFIDNLWKNLTLKVGHMEVNYGDQHFRRTDNANAMYNPFVGNYIMDAFNTEIGFELYWQKDGWLAMGGVTGGEIKGRVDVPKNRKPTVLGKFGYDTGPGNDLRYRVTGSVYSTRGSAFNTLYNGDRSGARYYSVMDHSGSAFTNGRYNPTLADQVMAFQINPFVSFGGLEVFGTYESATGYAGFEFKETGSSDPESRTWNQFAGEVLYRFLNDDKMYVGARYNRVEGQLPQFAPPTAVPPVDVSIDRLSVAAGWFVTPNVLFKAEYVNQNYNDFPTSNILHEGNFNGFMLEGVVGF